MANAANLSVLSIEPSKFTRDSMRHDASVLCLNYGIEQVLR